MNKNKNEVLAKLRLLWDRFRDVTFVDLLSTYTDGELLYAIEIDDEQLIKELDKRVALEPRNKAQMITFNDFMNDFSKLKESIKNHQVDVAERNVQSCLLWLGVMGKELNVKPIRNLKDMTNTRNEHIRAIEKVSQRVRERGFIGSHDLEVLIQLFIFLANDLHLDIEYTCKIVNRELKGE